MKSPVSSADHDPLAFARGGGNMGALIRNHDWRDSALGLPAQWPETLKSAVSMILNSGTAMHISWGDDLLQFYNDGYMPVLTDSKHPAALGRSVRESYPEIWDFIWPRFERVLTLGEAVTMENAGLMMYRDGELRECFFSFSYSPLKSLSGDVCGVISVCWETTDEVVARQRDRELRVLSEQLVAAASIEELRLAVRRHVDGNRANLPFLLWYERDALLDEFQLIKCRGISPDAPLVRELATRNTDSMLGQALDSRRPLARWVALSEPATPWLVDLPPTIEVLSVAVEPLTYINFSRPDGYLVFGVSVQRPFNASGKAFHEHICRAIEGAVRRINAVDLERREGQRQFDTVMRLTLDAAQIGYWDLDLKNPNPKRSAQHDRIFGYDEPLADWSYERFLEHVLPQDRERVNRLFKEALDAKVEWDIECRILRRDGALRWIWIHGDVMTNEAGDAVSTLGIVIDITDRKTAEVAIRESEQRFTSRLVALREDERKNLARELHDRVGQSLTALNINLSILRSQLPEHADRQLQARLIDSQVLIEATAAAIRNVMSDLRPPMLDDHGLVSALEWYAADIVARTGLCITVHDDGSQARPPADVEIALFRIAQEALNNVMKHARASRVEVRVAREGACCVLTVVDDGVGFDGGRAADAAHSGFGIPAMRERAEAVGGLFELKALPGRGTRLSASAPMP